MNIFYSLEILVCNVLKLPSFRYWNLIRQNWIFCQLLSYIAAVFTILPHFLISLSYSSKINYNYISVFLLSNVSKKSLHFQTFLGWRTVKPVYKDHHRGHKMVAVDDRWPLFKSHLRSKIPIFNLVVQNLLLTFKKLT